MLARRKHRLENLQARLRGLEVLVEFLPGVCPGLKFFGYGDELAEIIGRKVDFNTAGWLSAYFRDEVLQEALTVYEQA